VTERSLKNLPASIRQKLSDLARARKDDVGMIPVKYGLGNSNLLTMHG
jgi:hypothetical protein